MNGDIQDFMQRFVGRCGVCGHAMQSIAEVHVSGHYPSGLALTPTHWAITEVDDDEPTGIGCRECEKGNMHAVNVDRWEVPENLQVYCTVNL